ncbi:LOW QUALITY PROTEIN: WD repeat-containing protein 27 [Xyrauchen texanus]|uniref:LOW QUALITY PROTEIN: WD repeat-containing protein 27 n=1 Tax=Xyrauchen texanus TaxID=154827 RepID=UPI00224247F2|nr:LOW QUALITY PROTEIN: WD repeat-containing protein 27 [Xyrauchen texanus]
MADVISVQYWIERFSLTCNKPVSHLQLACCPSHCAVPWQDKNIRVYNTNNLEPPLELTGHHYEVSAMVFGKVRDRLILCSASEDYVIVWDIDRSYKQIKEGVIASGRVIGSLLGKVVHLSLCPQNAKVSACSGSRVFVLNAEREEVLGVLKGHLGPVTATEFCPWDLNLLISISEDRTFKAWDVKKGNILFQSAVLSAYPLLSLFFMEQNRQLITGSSDGQLWSYTLPADYKCCLVTKLDLLKLEQKNQKIQRHNSPPENGKEGTSNDDRIRVETAKSVLIIWSERPETNHACMQQRGSCVWIGSSDGLYLIDLDSSDLLMILPFKVDHCLSVSMAGSWAISKGRGGNMWCLVTTLFEPSVVLFEVNSAGLDDLCISLVKNFYEADQLSVVPSSPLLPTSPLNAELTKKGPKPQRKTGVSCQKSMKDQALVFHTQVKSSGYNAAPHRTMFKPKTNIKKKNNSPSKSSTNVKGLLSEYPSHSAAPSMPCTHLAVSTTPTTISSLQYSGDGKQIVCGLGDSSVLLYNSSLTSNPAVYTGHSKAVNSVCWSHCKQWFLTTSEEPSMNIWTTSAAEPVLTMGDEQFAKSIRSAQFYYLDKFLLLASGSNLLLYLYHLDTTRDDIKRYKQRSKSKLTKKFSMMSETDITAVSGINDFFSYIVLAAGADRTIQVFDMNRGCVANQIPDAHCRAVNHLTQNKGSPFCTQGPESYNLFLSSAITDGLKLWDLRSARCVRRYETHTNRCHHCTAAFSPCGRFIATGSEDQSAYIYDTRSNNVLLKLQRQSETVLNVAFNPAKPELLTGTLDGKLALFHPSESSLLL